MSKYTKILKSSLTYESPFFHFLIILYISVSSLSLSAQTKSDSILKRKTAYMVKNINTQPVAALSTAYEILYNPKFKLTLQKRSNTQSIVGHILNNQGYPVQALEYYMKAIELSYKVKDPYSIGYDLIEIGNIYFHSNNYLFAKEKYLEAIDVFAKRTNIKGKSIALNNLGLIAQEENNFNGALRFFQQALELRIQYQDTFLIMHSYKYIGDLYQKYNQGDKARSYYNRIIENGSIKGAANITGETYEIIAKSEMANGDKKTAMSFFRKAEGNYISEFNPKLLTQLYVDLADVCMDSNTKDSCIIWLEKALVVAEQNALIANDIFILNKIIDLRKQSATPIELLSYYEKLDKKESLRYAENIQIMTTRMETILKLSAQKRELEQKQEVLIQTKLLYEGFFVISILLALLLLLFYRFHIHKKKTQVHIQEQQKETYESQMNLKKLEFLRQQEQVELKQREVLYKNLLIQEKMNTLKKIKKDLEYNVSLLAAKNEKNIFKPMISSINTIIKQNPEWEELEKDFVKIHPGFYEQLLSKYPSLTSSDLKICLYLKMNLNTKDMVRITGLSVRAIENRRYRLRKKMNIAGNDNIAGYL